MVEHVGVEVGALLEPLRAVRTGERTVVAVGAEVDFEVGLVGGAVGALGAAQGPRTVSGCLLGDYQGPKGVSCRLLED